MAFTTGGILNIIAKNAGKATNTPAMSPDSLVEAGEQLLSQMNNVIRQSEENVKALKEKLKNCKKNLADKDATIADKNVTIDKLADRLWRERTLCEELARRSQSENAVWGKLMSDVWLNLQLALCELDAEAAKSRREEMLRRLGTVAVNALLRENIVSGMPDMKKRPQDWLGEEDVSASQLVTDALFPPVQYRQAAAVLLSALRENKSNEEIRKSLEPCGVYILYWEELPKEERERMKESFILRKQPPYPGVFFRKGNTLQRLSKGARQADAARDGKEDA